MATTPLRVGVFCFIKLNNKNTNFQEYEMQGGENVQKKNDNIHNLVDCVRKYYINTVETIFRTCKRNRCKYVTTQLYTLL